MCKAFELNYCGNKYTFESFVVNGKDTGVINVVYSNGIQGSFSIPYSWGITRVMQFIKSINKPV